MQCKVEQTVRTPTPPPTVVAPVVDEEALRRNEEALKRQAAAEAEAFEKERQRMEKESEQHHEYTLGAV